MTVVIRPAREADLAPAQALVVGSINDLTERHGFGAMASVRPTTFQSFSLRDDPAGLWVAEDDGALVGSVFSWACGDLWFLAELFVQPGRQGEGIGNALLARALDHAQRSGAAKRALITFAFNTVSQGLYIRHGMFPRLPLFIVSGTMPRAMEGQARLDAAPLTAADLDAVGDLDRQAIGVSREKHHRLLLGDSAMSGFALFARPGEIAGYAYVSSSGHIGPVAVTEPALLEAAFATALRLAAESGAARVSAFLPGTSEAALALAFRHGLRIAFPLVLACTPGFGDWTRYLPRNPGFM